MGRLESDGHNKGQKMAILSSCKSDGKQANNNVKMMVTTKSTMSEKTTAKHNNQPLNYGNYKWKLG